MLTFKTISSQDMHHSYVKDDSQHGLNLLAIVFIIHPSLAGKDPTYTYSLWEQKKRKIMYCMFYPSIYYRNERRDCASPSCHLLWAPLLITWFAILWVTRLLSATLWAADLSSVSRSVCRIDAGSVGRVSGEEVSVGWRRTSSTKTDLYSAFNQM